MLQYNITNIHAYVGFEPTIAVLERAKTVRALDRSATAIGLKFIMTSYGNCCIFFQLLL
jgi:hypothetical protein